MRVPHENYIRFLITTGLDSDGTNENLQSLELPKCSVEYWDKQYEALHGLSLPRQIKKYWNNPHGSLPNGFLDYMNVAGVREAWLYNCGKNKDFVNAIEALKDFDISLTIRALLLVKTQSDEISAIINGKYGVVFSKNSAQFFKQYFFNTDIMSRVFWREYFKSLTNEEKSILYMGLAGKDVELRAELGLPNKISVSEHFQKLHVYAMTKFVKYSKAGNPQSDEQARKWALLAMSSGKEYEKMKLTDATDFSRDLQMEFEYTETEFQTIGSDDLDEIKANKDAGQNNDSADPIPFEDLDE